ncbi:MAG: peptidoglycan-binding protein [endosymbiont of Galathealinum brachiosum]|uniref:Peptidoglycan-binding protein n=1 Tax=endosymbiont of Galathealinum brachiosum TaxID=2200906 RepID=A0A370DN46_9GAMM|nr:MAG: peptidoglycan-binding protein [endosymbiont of Galathealinum brachiosum]
MKGILSSVGKSGKNIREDVHLIQDLLNHKIKRMPGEKRLIVDGLIGPKTIKLITKYQSIVLKMKKPDGRVDSGGKTFKSLYENYKVTPHKLTPKVTMKYWEGDSARWSQDKKLQSLNAQFRTKVKAVVKALKNEGFKPKIFYGWRSVAVQLELYNKKRSKVKFSFHNATLKGGIPNSYAVDIIDSRYAWSDKPETKKFWEALGKAAKDNNLYWGGDWTSFKDWAHVQMHPNSKLKSIKLESKQAESM